MMGRLTSHWAHSTKTREIEGQNAVTLGSNIAGQPVSVLGLFPIPIGQQFTPQESTAYSVFAQFDWELNDQWSLVFRWSLFL